MSNKIKTLLGRNVYVVIPEKPESKIIVPENTKDSLEQALLISLSKLKIFAVGHMAEKSLSPGDSVLVNPSAISGDRARILTLETNDGKEIRCALIQDHDIIHIWE